MSMKNPVRPAGIEPATFRFVAQHLNHSVTAVPPTLVAPYQKKAAKHSYHKQTESQAAILLF